MRVVCTALFDLIGFQGVFKGCGKDSCVIGGFPVISIVAGKVDRFAAVFSKGRKGKDACCDQWWLGGLGGPIDLAEPVVSTAVTNGIHSASIEAAVLGGIEPPRGKTLASNPGFETDQMDEFTGRWIDDRPPQTRTWISVSSQRS